MNVREVFDIEPDHFLETPERLIQILRARGKEGPDESKHFTLAHWEEMAGVPCPDDLRNLLVAFAETGAYNTALGRLIVMVHGYGNALLIPHGVNGSDHEVEWTGMFSKMLGDDPGGDHASGLRDLVRNRIEIGGDPFYFYDLDTGRITRQSATSLSAMVYGCCLVLAHQLEWPNHDFEASAEQALRHLKQRASLANALLDCLDERGSTLQHDMPWAPDWREPTLRVVDGPGTSIRSREWVLQLQNAYSIQEYQGSLEENELAKLRVWLHAAEPPAAQTLCAATAIYAGLYTYFLEPENLEAWSSGVEAHPSRLVADARETILGRTNAQLERLRPLAERAIRCTALPDAYLSEVEPDPLMATLLHTHGTL
jgi:hypothetical protein